MSKKKSNNIVKFLKKNWDLILPYLGIIAGIIVARNTTGWDALGYFIMGLFASMILTGIATFRTFMNKQLKKKKVRLLWLTPFFILIIWFIINNVIR